MFQVFLCDDNEIILEGLSTQIDWLSLNLTLTGTATNGQDAWLQVQKQIPDLLITDIRMPDLDGLELARRTKELNPNLAILIISAYDDFEYARTAVHLGAIDYILKPIDMAVMNRLLKTAVSHCQQRSHGKLMNQIELFRSIIFQEPDEATVKERCRQVSLEYQQYCCVMSVRIHESSLKSLTEKVQYALERKFSLLAESFQQPNTYMLEISFSQYILCITASTQSELIQLRKAITQQVRSQFPSDDYYDVTIASGDIYPDISKISSSMTDCQKALNLRFIKGSNATVFYEEVRCYIQSAQNRMISSEELNIDFCTLIKAQDKDGILEQLDFLKTFLYEKGGESFLYLTLTVGTLYTRLAKELGESGINIQDAFSDPIEEFKKVTAHGTLETTMENLRQSLFEICDCIKRNKSKYGKIVDQALCYIQAHYNQSTFSIEEVATAISLSPSYFSTIFKNEIGSTFTDYLIGIRISKAKELLANTDMKMYEVSSLVGYENAAYFSVAFKRSVGISPSEYQSRQSKPSS